MPSLNNHARYAHPVDCEHCGRSTEGRMERRFLEGPAHVLDRREVVALAAAIQRGDMAEAALQLDIVFRDEPVVGEWIAQGRYSRAA